MQKEIQIINVIPPQHWQNYVKALQISQLSYPNEILCRDTLIDGNGTYLHEILTVQNRQLPHLVLIHGFGATSLQYIRMFKYLHKKFNIHALDILGFGYSDTGNPKANCTGQEAINYFIQALEKWRTCNNIDQFNLAGHSFGGYLAAEYANRYRKIVKTLSLLSPVGFSGDKYNEDKSWLKSIIHCIPQKIYNIKFKPSTQFRSKITGGIAKYTALKKLRIEQGESQIWKKYFENISQRTESNQQLFYTIFKWPVVPQKTILDIFSNQDIRFPIQVFFGSKDWMLGHTNALQYKQKLQQLYNFQVLQGAGHEITMHKPQQLAIKIINIAQNSNQ